MSNYWDEVYWEKHLKEDDLDNIEDLWIKKYEDLYLKKDKLKVLDLGCGVGQYTSYFLDKGYEVVSTDISSKALDYLKNKYPNVEIVLQDMTETFKFNDNEFDIVFANLSIHFFSEEDTNKLIKEIYRILKTNGLFIGSVNSVSAYEFIKDHVTEIEKNYYNSKGRKVRLFNKEQFDMFFKDYKEIVLNEVIETRFNHSKNMWEFIYKK